MQAWQKTAQLVNHQAGITYCPADPPPLSLSFSLLAREVRAGHRTRSHLHLPFYLGFEELGTGWVIICVGIVSICPTEVDKISSQTQIHQQYQHFEVHSSCPHPSHFACHQQILVTDN